MAGGGLTYADVGAAVIYRARIVDVDVRYYVVSVAAENLKKPLTDISFATPYQHFENGEGMYFMPEVGSICWLCEPSDGSKPFVLAWASASEEGDYRAQKMDLNPGDIYLGTRDENHILLRRGGVIQIAASPLAQRLFLPINNTIRDFCQNYGLHTLGGDLTWTVDIPETTKDGTSPTRLSLSAREMAEDRKPVATLEIGSHVGDADAILTLVLNDSGADSQKPKVTLKMTKAGDVSWLIEGKVSWTFKDELTIKVTKDATVSSEASLNLEGALKAVLTGGAVLVESKSGAVAVDAKAGMTVSTSGGGPALSAGSASNFVLLDSLLSWLTTHVHDHPTVGPTLQPTQPIPPNVVSKNLKA